MQHVSHPVNHYKQAVGGRPPQYAPRPSPPSVGAEASSTTTVFDRKYFSRPFHGRVSESFFAQMRREVCQQQLSFFFYNQPIFHKSFQVTYGMV